MSLSIYLFLPRFRAAESPSLETCVRPPRGRPKSQQPPPPPHPLSGGACLGSESSSTRGIRESIRQVVCVVGYYITSVFFLFFLASLVICVLHTHTLGHTQRLLGQPSRPSIPPFFILVKFTKVGTCLATHWTANMLLTLCYPCVVCLGNLVLLSNLPYITTRTAL